MPPTHSPLRLEAPILSRMRSEVTSRSNWAKDSSTFSVSRPIEVVVLKAWVTETNDTCGHRRARPAWRSRPASGSDDRPCRPPRCRSDRLRCRSAGAAGPDGSGFRRKSRHRRRRPSGADQPSCSLALDVGLSGLALGIETVEVLIEPLVGRHPGVDDAADASGGSEPSWRPLPGFANAEEARAAPAGAGDGARHAGEAGDRSRHSRQSRRPAPSPVAGRRPTPAPAACPGARLPAPGTATGCSPAAPLRLAERGEQAQRGLVAITEGVGLQPVGQDLDQQVRGTVAGSRPAHEPTPVQPQRRQDRGRAGARPRLRPAPVGSLRSLITRPALWARRRRCGRPRSDPPAAYVRCRSPSGASRSALHAWCEAAIPWLRSGRSGSLPPRARAGR